MSHSAKVQSTDAIVDFRTALATFARRAEDALETLSGELRRTGEWLEHDRPAFWRQQQRAAADQVHKAKLELERCLMFTVADQRPACREQRDALKAAQRRVEYCREKAELVQHWNRTLHHEMHEYDGRIGTLRRLLEADVPLAMGRLAQIIRRLDAYRVENAPTAASNSPVDMNSQTDEPE